MATRYQPAPWHELGLCAGGTVKTGKDVPWYTRPTGNAFTPDERTLLASCWGGQTGAWQPFSGELRRALNGPPEGFAGRADMLLGTALSADGKKAALVDARGVLHVWEDMTSPTCLAFSPAGKYLLAAHNVGGLEARGRSDGINLRLWDLATGRELRRFQAPPCEIRALAISPDGKTLAAGANDTVLLWELASGKARGRFPGHREWVWSLAFSPSGRLLASGSLDHTALVWDVTGTCPDGQLPARTPQPDEMERLWTALASADGIRAYRALWMMIAAARPSVSLLAERLRPKQPVEGTRLERLIAELDSDQFKNRVRASQELEELGELAETALRKALAGTQSLEVRRRVDDLLHKVEAQTLSPEQLLTLRALEVLEQIGTPEAKQVLQNLAKVAPEARLTQEAKASLERVSRRP